MLGWLPPPICACRTRVLRTFGLLSMPRAAKWTLSSWTPGASGPSRPGGITRPMGGNGGAIRRILSMPCGMRGLAMPS
eukprot:15433203-Alexandrium_andersonii.AAC.1